MHPDSCVSVKEAIHDLPFKTVTLTLPEGGFRSITKPASCISKSETGVEVRRTSAMSQPRTWFPIRRVVEIHTSYTSLRDGDRYQDTDGVVWVVKNGSLKVTA